MIIDKKYLDRDYIGKLCVGAVRYDFPKNNTSTLISFEKLLSYVIDDNVNIVDILTEIYESEHPVFLKTLGYIIKFKIYEPNITNDVIKQKLIDTFEKKIDNLTFNKIFNFISAVFGNVSSNNISNLHINKEFDKMLKYILLNASYKSVGLLYNEFYENPESVDKYDPVITKVFKRYENSIVSKDFTIDDSEESIEKALSTSSNMGEDIREIEILKDIKFVEKKRVGIAVAPSGVGKSMFLCHCSAEYFQKPKSDNKKHIIFYYTFENSKEETFVRVMANVLEIEIDVIKQLATDQAELSKLSKSFKEKIDPNTILKIVELPPKKHSMATIEADIRKTLTKYNDAEVYAVILDYIDKMKPMDMSNKTKRYDQQLGDVVDDFKALVNMFETAGISVSQVNRMGVKKSKNADDWNMTDIGGSWEKVENADIILLLDVENTAEELGYNMVAIKNEKHRYYKDGSTIAVLLRPQFAKFSVAPENMMDDMFNHKKGRKLGEIKDNTRLI